jgi:hypothetical protein
MSPAQDVGDFMLELATRFASPVKPTRQAAQGRAASSSSADLQHLHVALDGPGVRPGTEGSTSAWCRELGISEGALRRQLIDMINVRGPQPQQTRRVLGVGRIVCPCALHDASATAGTDGAWCAEHHHCHGLIVVAAFNACKPSCPAYHACLACSCSPCCLNSLRLSWRASLAA